METITITVDGITSHERESQSIYTHFFWIPMGTLQPQNGTGGGRGGQNGEETNILVEFTVYGLTIVVAS